VIGNAAPEKISTSYVERQNLTMRTGMRRFTRLTDGFSKTVENFATPSVSTTCTIPYRPEHSPTHVDRVEVRLGGTS